MPAPIRRYDELGFPIASTFEELSKGEIPVRPAGPSRAKRRIMIVLLLVVAALAVAPWAKSAFQTVAASVLANRAEKKLKDGDFAGTVADSTKALELKGNESVTDDHVRLFYMRAMARLELNDLDGSVRDFSRVLEAKNLHPALAMHMYRNRAWANCRAGNHRQAIDDANQAIQLVGNNSRELPELLNNRAYIRALGNLDRKELEAGLDDIQRAMAMVRRNPEYIDTRGYLYHLLGKQDEALKDLNHAIALTMRNKDELNSAQDDERFAHNLAVMHYHRALVHQASGKTKEANADMDLAKKLGYDPDAGVL
jgi:tetratricopeptide (TPR) repeat protein